MAQFSMPQFDLKRKRFFDDESIQDIHTSKRLDLKQLPIRSPPLSRSFLPPNLPRPQLEPSTNSFDATEGRVSQHEEPSTPQRPNSRSISITVNGTTSVLDTAMATTPPSRIGRARSNDLMSPVRSVSMPHPTINLHNSSPSSSFARERVPTPMTSTFASSLRSPLGGHFATTAPWTTRAQVPMTALSPFSDAESWTPQPQHQNPGSPDIDRGRDCDLSAYSGQDTEMLETDDSNNMSSSFDHLSVRSADASHIMLQQQRQHLNTTANANLYRSRSPATTTTSSNSNTVNQAKHPSFGLGLRTGRDPIDSPMNDPDSDSNPDPVSSYKRAPKLQMGFRADCEKCLDRVPGHYSHILWT